MFTTRAPWLIAIAALATLAIALAAACSDSNDSPAEVPTATADPALTGLVIKLIRLDCGIGGCPWGYDLTIHGDGSVEYEGSGEVAVVGLATASISQTQVRLLSDRFDDIGFADLEGIACSGSDGPRTTLTLIREPTIDVTFEFCPFPLEPALVDLAYLIDEVTDSRQWVGLPNVMIRMTRGFYPAAGAEDCGRPLCRNYQLTIQEDGRVEYEGLQNVDVIGTRSGEISEADVLDLADRFLESGFLDLPPDFHCQITDVGATTTTVWLNTRGNSIVRCHVDDPSGRLDELKEIENLIDELTDSQRWTGETE